MGSFRRGRRFAGPALYVALLILLNVYISSIYTHGNSEQVGAAFKVRSGETRFHWAALVGERFFEWWLGIWRTGFISGVDAGDEWDLKGGGPRAGR